MKEFLNFINGEYVKNVSGKMFDDINPVNGQVIGKIYEAGRPEVDAAVAAAKAALKGDWGRISVVERAKLLVQVATRLRALRGRDVEEAASTRLLIYAATLIVGGMSLERAVDVAMLQPLTDDPAVMQGLRDLVSATLG